jgi:drug/metabolite transporter (DMT)-like permease
MDSFILLAILVLDSLASYGISSVIYKRLVRTGSRLATPIRVGSFVLSFIIILFGIIVLILYNVKLER